MADQPDAADELLPILVCGEDADGLACPHCGTTGLENFIYIEDIQNFREL